MVQEHVVGPDAGPIALRYPRGNAPSIDWPVQETSADGQWSKGDASTYTSPPIVPGKAEVLQHGEDVALLAYGNMVAPAFEAVKILEAEGISVEFINLRWAKPLDKDAILEAARRTGKLIVMEEGIITGGVGSGVLELLAANGVSNVQVRLFGVPDKFIEHGAIPILHRLCMLTSQDFAAAARDMLGRRQPEPERMEQEGPHEALTA